jgi:hypothetical protein
MAFGNRVSRGTDRRSAVSFYSMASHMQLQTLRLRISIFQPNVQAWVPLVLTPDRFKRGMNMDLSIFARLRNGISGRQAQQRVDHQVSSATASEGGVELRNLGYGIDVRSLSSHIAGDLGPPLLLLWFAALVLLIAACANVAAVLLARAGSRRKEIAIRISVGASRFQILRQLCTESVILALLGGVAGLLVAAVSLELLKHDPLPYQQLLMLVRLNERCSFMAFPLLSSAASCSD